MSDKELYDLLHEERSIPWDRAAYGFLMLKVASGGVLAEDVEEFEKVALNAEVSQEMASRALGSGILSGIRRSSSGDIAHASAVRRKRGERIGKTTGSIAGTAAGMLAAKKLGIPRSHAGALGALLGYGSGKAIGEEVDRARAKARMKRASIEKTAASKEERKARFHRMLKIVGTAAGAGAVVGGGRAVWRHRQGLKHLREIAKILGPGWNEKVNQMVRAGAKKSALPYQIASGASLGAAGAVPFGTTAHYINEKLRQRKKTAAAPAEPALPTAMAPPGGNPMEEFLQAQQEANEAEFFKQQAEEAQASAQMQEQRAAVLEQQLQTTQQTAQMQQQDSAMKDQANQQQTVMAQQQAQQAQQEAVMARDESLTAQQANIALRQAVTSYRQQLMDLLSQDPTQQVPPAAAPQGAPPEMQQGAAPQPAQAMPEQQPAAPPPGGQAAAAPPAGAAAPASMAPPAQPDLQMMQPPALTQGAQ